MAEANRVHSTPPTNTSVPSIDPIFTAIERHRTAHADFVAAVGVKYGLEEEIPSDRRQSSVAAW